MAQKGTVSFNPSMSLQFFQWAHSLGGGHHNEGPFHQSVFAMSDLVGKIPLVKLCQQDCLRWECISTVLLELVLLCSLHSYIHKLSSHSRS